MANQEAPSTEHRDFVKALATGLDIILAFDKHHSSMTLTDVAERLRINRAKARRFLITLHALGYVRQQDRYYELTPRVLDLGFSYLSAGGYQSAAMQYLEEVTETTGESCSMGTLDGTDVIYVARSAAHHRLMTMAISIGTRLPALYTSMGRVLLATQREPVALDWLKSNLKAHTPYSITSVDVLQEEFRGICEKGFCILDQELEVELRSLAVPVFNRRKLVVGAINVSTSAARVPVERLKSEFLPLLQSASEKIGMTIS